MSKAYEMTVAAVENRVIIARILCAY
ncbi:hypothetical protein [Holospora curviuscula]